MTEERGDQFAGLDRALLRGMTQRRLSRRNLIKYAGMSVGALSLSSILAACGGDGGTTGGGGDGGAVDPSKIFSGELAGELDFANWPLYIDKAKDASGERISPTLENFKKEYGTTVNYQDVIQDGAEFFAQLQPQLAAGDSTGWDIIVMTNGQQFTALTQNEWVWPLDSSKRPNFDANAADWAKDPFYDPGNKYGMPWQSGITGIGTNTEQIPTPISNFQDLADPDKVGMASVGMLTGDMPDWTMIQLGIDPQTSGPAEWQEAADWLLMQRDSGTVRGYYGNEYINDFDNGNLAAAMVWSGDILYYNVWLRRPFIFQKPDNGALLWIDNMMVPANAEHPVDAMTMMDYVYDPAVAQGITEWVLYMSPVPAVQDLIAEHAEKVLGAGNAPAYGHKLEETASSPFLWPDKELLSQVSFGRDIKTDEELEQWNSIFLPISES